MNRVEGDLEFRVDLADGRVRDAWASGTMYRGIENILIGRDPLDALVITPRVCGICSTTHLAAAAKALDSLSGSRPPPDAVRLRNVALGCEHIQSDIRQIFLMFMADFANPAYAGTALYEEAVGRYEPFRGSTVLQVLQETKRVIEIIAIIGGQWPHSSYMVPGGIVSRPSTSDLVQCRLLLKQYRRWFERRILGCSIERWSAIGSSSDLDAWLEESDQHRSSDLGFFARLCRAAGLDKTGSGHDNFISYGGMEIPEGSAVQEPALGSQLVPAGVLRGSALESFDQGLLAEHVSHSWFVDYGGGRHPFRGETRPYATGQESDRYSWAKAPRYDGLPAETGPLAEMLIARRPLFVDIAHARGASVFVRVLARLARPATLIPAMEKWMEEARGDGEYYSHPPAIEDGEAFGLVEAARGGLGHWVRIENGAISHYQIITPTAWNASPRDSAGWRGPMEEALIGTAVKDPENPVEVGHVIRSFDPCLVCTVHALKGAPSEATRR